MHPNRAAAVWVLLAASAAGIAATGTAPALFIALSMMLTVVAFVIAYRGQSPGRNH